MAWPWKMSVHLSSLLYVVCLSELHSGRNWKKNPHFPYFLFVISSLHHTSLLITPLILLLRPSSSVFLQQGHETTHTHTHTYIHTDKQTLAGVCIQMAALKRTWSQSCFRSGAPWGKPSRYFAKDRNCSSTALVMWTRDDWTKERKCKPWFKQTECSCKPLFCLGTKNGVKHVNKYTFILITGHDLTYRAPSTCFKCYLHPYSTQDA